MLALSQRSPLFLLPAAVCLSLLALATAQLGALWALGLAGGIAAVVCVLIWPEVAGLAALFLIYSNAPVAFIQKTGAPAGLAALASLLLLIPLLHYLVALRRPIRMDTTAILMPLFLIVLVASSLFAKDKLLAWQRIGIYVAEGMAIYLLILNIVRTAGALKRALWSVLLAGSFLAALTLYQSATGSFANDFAGLAQRKIELEVSPATVDAKTKLGITRSDRALGSVGDPNRYAQILLVLLPMAIFHFCNTRHRLGRVAALATGGLLLFGILFTYSRGALVALVLMAGLAACLRVVRPMPVIAIGMIALSGLLVLAPSYRQRAASIAEVGMLFSKRTSANAEAVIRGRFTEMLAALHVFLEHPLLGVGPGHYAPYYSESYQLRPELKFRALNRARQAHNLYLGMAAETGLVGLAVFLAMPALLLRDLWRARRRWLRISPEFAGLATALSFSIVAYLATGLFLHLAFERYYWLLLALAGVVLQVFRHTEAREPQFAAQEAWRPYPVSASLGGAR